MRGWWEVTVRELAWAWRRQRRRKSVLVLAVLVLGLAMGANTAMFSVYYRLVADPLPFPSSRQLIWIESVDSGGAVGGLSTPDLLDYRSQARMLQHMAGFATSTATLLGRGAPQHVAYADVTGDFFPALGVQPRLGRTLTRRDEVKGGPLSAVLSYGLWQESFGGNPDVVGKTADFDNAPLTIVGVMPPGFDYPAGTQVWVPNDGAYDPNALRSWRYLSVFARMQPGVSEAAAQQELSALAGRMRQTYPKDDAGIGLRVTPMAAHVAGPMAPTLLLMMIGALLVLLLACANVGNLLLGAAAARWRELALQLSLGAGRRRLLGHLLAEGAVLALLSALLGWLLAVLLMPVLRHWQAENLQWSQVGLNGAVLLFAAAITVVVAVWFALAPAWELLRPTSVRNLLQAAGPRLKRSPLSSWLVMVEVTVTVVLLVGAGLFWQNLRALDRATPGFDSRHVLSFRTTLLYNSEAELRQKLPFFDHLRQSLSVLPGVQAAGMTSDLPLAKPAVTASVAKAGAAPVSAALDRLPTAGLVAVEPGYFAALGVAVRGRALEANDEVDSGPPAVVITQALARKIFPNADPLGRSLDVVRGGIRLEVRVVGEVGYQAQGTPGGPPQETLYMPEERLHSGTLYALVRGRTDPQSLLPAIRRLVARLDPQVAVYDVASMQQRLDTATAAVRYRTNLLAAMALLALLLAAAGLYAVLAHLVAQRRRDIGIRMALGASVGQVGKAVLAQSFRLVVAGIVAGMLLSWWLRRSVQPLLPFSGVADVWTWVGVPALVLLIGLLASSVPVWRAAHVDPAQTLRHD